MKGDDRPYVMAFSHIQGVGPLSFTALLKRYPSAQAAYNARYTDLKTLIGVDKANIIEEFRSDFDIQNKWRELQSANIKIIARDDPLYAPQLRTLYDPPICLYAKGDINNFSFESDFIFAVVGTRRSSTYGRDVVARITADLTRAGMVIVSGMALGIDAAAHESCLAEGGRTIAVLGNGVDIIYPSQNRWLYNQILRSGGLILSEWPPGMMSQKGLFVSRNRIIAGLSRGLLVVEGTESSGALISARCALDQGKDIFAVPGLVTNNYSQASHILIKNGAKLTTNAEDILEEYFMRAISHASLQVLPNLSQNEQNIYNILLRESKKIDELVVDTQLPVTTILTTLSFLELKGLVGKNSDTSYLARSPA